MNKIKIISDSSCDLNELEIAKNNIKIVPFSVSFDSTTYLKENIDITNEVFFEKLQKEKAFPKTSLPSIEDYIIAFEEQIELENKIICICISSNFSGSYQSAVNAKEITLEKYPNAIINIIDSQQATAPQGLLVLKASKMIENNEPFETIVSTIESLKNNIVTYFTLESLENLQRGGRIGKASAVAGTLLNIKPVLCLKDGELLPVAKVRGYKGALAQVVTCTNDHINSLTGDYTIEFIYIMNDNSIQSFKEEMSKNYGENREYRATKLGVTIGAHTGHTAVGIVVANFTI